MKVPGELWGHSYRRRAGKCVYVYVSVFKRDTHTLCECLEGGV